MRPVVTLTMNPALDLSTQVERVVSERKLRCGPPRRDPGGGGVNVSRVVHELGGRTVAYYPVGGPVGDLFRELLDQVGIEHCPIPIRGWTREDVTVLDESSGKQFRFLLPGPELSKDECERCLEALEAQEPAPDYLVASGSLPPGVPDDFYGQVARVSERLGSRFVVDTSGPALRRAAEAGAFLLKPNLRELGELAGQPIEDEEQQTEAALRLVREGRSQIVVVSLGAAGVLVASQDGVERLRSPTVPIRSKVGAGDSMVGGLVLGLARGQSVREAIRLGLAAGAAAVMTPGTQLCRRADTERLFSRLSQDEK